MKNKPVKTKDEWCTCRDEAILRMKHIEEFDQEVVCLITLSPEMRVIGDHLLSVGSFHSTYLPIQVLLNRVITDKAYGFIIGHNHPNGVGIFSEIDVVTVMRLLFICEILEINFVDSLVFPHEKEASSLYKTYPTIFKPEYNQEFEKAIEKFIPKKLRGT